MTKPTGKSPNRKRLIPYAVLILLALSLTGLGVAWLTGEPTEPEMPTAAPPPPEEELADPVVPEPLAEVEVEELEELPFEAMVKPAKRRKRVKKQPPEPPPPPEEPSKSKGSADELFDGHFEKKNADKLFGDQFDNE